MRVGGSFIGEPASMLSRHSNPIGDRPIMRQNYTITPSIHNTIFLVAGSWTPGEVATSSVL